MKNPFSQFMTQTELSLSDLSRRAVDSVTIPIKIKSQEVVSELTATVKASLLSIAIKAGLGLFAGVMFLIALGYGLSALHARLALSLGPIEATLIMAGVFLALAVIAVLALVFWPSGTASKAATAKAADAKAVAARSALASKDAEAMADKARRSAAALNAAAQAGAPAADLGPLTDMKSGIGAIASALGEAGFRREQAGLRAGLAIAEQLKPMQIVSLALVGGFVAGMRMRRRR